MTRGGARGAAFAALAALEAGAAPRLELQVGGLAARDRDLALELARGVERLRLLLDVLLGAWVRRGMPESPALRTALRLGAYQLLFLTRIPPHAAVGETVALVRHQRGFVNAVLRRLAAAIEAGPAAASRRRLELPGARSLLLPDDRLPDPAGEPVARLALEHGLPEFLVQRWSEHHGFAAARAIAIASSSRPALWIRTNRRLADRDALLARLAAERLAVAPGPTPELLRWQAPVPPQHTRAFADGWYVVQDPTAAAAAAAVGAAPGERILDLCAAPGTKASALAAGVAPGGQVVAWDADPERRVRIAETRARLRLGELLVVPDELGDEIGFDAALVDVPCSNTGVLARRVEVRRRLHPGFLAELPALQRRLLQDALARVRPGARVVYSTCSLEPEENEQIVAAAVAAGARLETERLTLPAAGEHDGGYFAMLRAPAPAARG